MKLQIMVCTAVMVVLFALHAWAQDGDPWGALRQKYADPSRSGQGESKSFPEKKDPWARLRQVFLPFSEEEEILAVKSPKKATGLAKKINNRLSPYQTVIGSASKAFNVPVCVIKAVIMAESGGDKDAATRLSSAKGLMQTIDGTFWSAKKGLAARGIAITDDPFDPQASIMAGTWYLDRMYGKAKADGKIGVGDRKNPEAWRYPLEYYYAGPGNGAKPENRIIVFSNGTKRVIDKRAYSKKIETWAKILAAS